MQISSDHYKEISCSLLISLSPKPFSTALTINYVLCLFPSLVVDAPDELYSRHLQV